MKRDKIKERLQRHEALMRQLMEKEGLSKEEASKRAFEQVIMEERGE